MAKQRDRSGFPKVIFCKWDGDDDSRYLLVDLSPEAEDVEDGERVAVYELREVHTKRIVHSLE